MFAFVLSAAPRAASLALAASLAAALFPLAARAQAPGRDPDPAAGAPAAYTYTFRMTTRSTDAKGKTRDEPPLVARVHTLGDRARIEILEGSKDYAPGDYVLTDARGSVIRSVSPKKGEYSEATVDDVQRTIAKKLKVTVDRPRVSIGVPAPAERVAGQPTRRTRLERAYALEMRLLLLSQRAMVDETTDVWTTDALPGFANPAERIFTGFRRAIAHGGRGAAGSLAERTRDAERELPGVPLRTVTTVVSETKDGRATDEITMEVSDVRTGAPRAAADFELPSGYRRKGS